MWYLRGTNFQTKGCENNAYGHAGAGWYVPLRQAMDEVLAG